MSRIVKGYWTCKYCETRGIDGLVDICPNCGKQKSEDVKYYIEGAPVEVTDSELRAAGISREECDGEHKDWVCNYCNQLNNFSDESCVACSAPKTEATKEYGCEIRKDIEGYIDRILEAEEPEPITRGLRAETNPIDDYRGSRFNTDIIKRFLVGGLIGLFAMLLAWLFWPISRTVRVSSFSWDRVVTVEEMRTVKEDGWSVPTGGRVYDERREIKGYEKVIDHYETVYEQKSRQVIDHYETVYETKTRQVISHYETTYTYKDNGNGTFTEVPHQKPVYTTETYTDSHQEPVYKTEYYTETRQEPVYRDEPIYDTKYYYEIDKWFDLDDYPSSGADHEPYWNTSYELGENERDTQRWEKYSVWYDDGSSEVVGYDIWAGMNIGDGFVLTQNRLGMTYSRESVVAGVK